MYRNLEFIFSFEPQNHCPNAYKSRGKKELKGKKRATRKKELQAAPIRYRNKSREKTKARAREEEKKSYEKKRAAGGVEPKCSGD